jgi:hypothetical protein
LIGQKNEERFIHCGGSILFKIKKYSLKGLDRCGKSTQVELFRKKYNFVEMNFPDRETEIGKSINSYLKSKSDLNDEAIHLLFSGKKKKKLNFPSKSMGEAVRPNTMLTHLFLVPLF